MLTVKHECIVVPGCKASRMRRVVEPFPKRVPSPCEKNAFLQTGLFGAITPLLSFPKNRKDYFDVASAGPLLGTFVSLAVFIVGIIMTGSATPVSLSVVAVLVALMLLLFFLVVVSIVVALSWLVRRSRAVLPLAGSCSTSRRFRSLVLLRSGWFPFLSSILVRASGRYFRVAASCFVSTISRALSPTVDRPRAHSSGAPLAWFDSIQYNHAEVCLLPLKGVLQSLSGIQRGSVLYQTPRVVRVDFKPFLAIQRSCSPSGYLFGRSVLLPFYLMEGFALEKEHSPRQCFGRFLDSCSVP